MRCVRMKSEERNEMKNYDQMKKKNAIKKIQDSNKKKWQVNKLPSKLGNFHVLFNRENSNLN